MTKKSTRLIRGAALLACIGACAAARADVVGTFTAGGFTSGTFMGALGQVVIGRSADQTLQSGIIVASTAPTVVTNAATAIGPTTATLNATINPRNLATTAKFEYGLTSSYGSETTITLAPNDGTSNQNVSVSLTGLAPLTTYHFRASATNSDGTTVGIDRTFKTLEAPSLIVTTPNTSTNSDGLTSLSEAIAFANSNADNSAISFSATVFAAPRKTIAVGSELTLSQPVTITGPTAGVVINGVNKSFRLFFVASGIRAGFDGLTVINGTAGIFNNGTTTVTNSTLRDNNSNFHNASGTATLTGCTSSGTSSDGINNSGGTTSLINCTLSSSGNGLVNIGSSNTVNLTNCTVSGNGQSGILNNGTANVNNSIVAGNGAANTGSITGSNNITTGTADAAGLETSNSANAVVLKNNGGPTPTIALVKNGTALDKGNNALVPAGITTDQRGAGFARIQNGTVDIGAFEAADKTAPTVTITIPVDESTVNTLTPISGTASDSGGVTRVDLYLERLSDRNFWNGTTWTANSPASRLTTTLTTTSSGVNWTRTSGLPTGSDLITASYIVSARAFDPAGNSKSVSALVNVDVDLPAVTIASPVDNAILNSKPTINGFVVDARGGSGIARVELLLRRNGDGLYWNGTQWVGKTPIVLPTRLAGDITGNSWKYEGALPTVIATDQSRRLTDGSYTIVATAVDRAGNRQKDVHDFFVDTTSPLVAITAPADGAQVSSLTPISGTTRDVGIGSGVRRVDLNLQRNSDGKYWNGSTWTAFSATESRLTTTLTPSTSGATWSRNSGLPMGAQLQPGTYRIVARATDGAGNGTSAAANVTVTAPRATAPSATPSPVQLSSSSAKSGGTIHLTFTSALGAGATNGSNYGITRGDTVVEVQSVQQPTASEVIITADGLTSGARIAVNYDLKDTQGRSIKGTTTVVVK
jgi:hypothetical protein